MEKLLHHYEQELVRLREATRRYAEAHPNTAEALELGPDASTDPEVERLLQSVALLNAATQKMIEDGRSEFHRALLQTLQPHYLRKLPASIYVLAEILAVTLADKLRGNRFAQIRIANENGQLLYCAKPRVGTRPLL